MIPTQETKWPFLSGDPRAEAYKENVNLASAVAEGMKGITSENMTDAAIVIDLLVTWGFESYTYNFLGSIEKPLCPPKRVMHSLPRGLITAYDDMQYHNLDAAYLHALYARTPIFYEDLFKKLMDSDDSTNIKVVNLEIRSLYFAFGFDDLCLVPVIEDDQVGAFMICTRTPQETKLLRQII